MEWRADSPSLSQGDGREPDVGRIRYVARKKVKRAPQKSRARSKKKGYSPGEWFMVILGLALVIMFVVIIVTSIFGL